MMSFKIDIKLIEGFLLQPFVEAFNFRHSSLIIHNFPGPCPPRKNFSYADSHRTTLYNGISHWYHFPFSFLLLPTANRLLPYYDRRNLLVIFVILVIVVWIF
jgi:hypothetical protein